MIEVLKRPLAKNDIKEIWRYIYEHWGETQADIYTKELGKAIYAMANNPMIGVNIEHVREGYRLYHFKRHLIVYRLTAARIEVVRVLGENMNIKRQLTLV